MALIDHERVEYEQEAFPERICRISDPKIVFLLFSSGKIIIIGGKTLDNVKAGLDILMEKLSAIDQNAKNWKFLKNENGFIDILLCRNVHEPEVFTPEP